MFELVGNLEGIELKHIKPFRNNQSFELNRDSNHVGFGIEGFMVRID